MFYQPIFLHFLWVLLKLIFDKHFIPTLNICIGYDAEVHFQGFDFTTSVFSHPPASFLDWKRIPDGY